MSCNEPPETGSDITETGWEETYRGASRKWLTRTQATNLPQKSTMKDTYRFPYEEERQYVGTRRAQALQELYEQAAEEIIAERNAPPPVEKYCTEYDGNFSTKIEQVQSEEEKQKLYEKFPLHTSEALSYWNYKIESQQKSNTAFTGLTSLVDLKRPFRRSSGFTKPIEEVLDDSFL